VDYLEALHKAHKARLRRLGAAAQVNGSKTEPRRLAKEATPEPWPRLAQELLVAGAPKRYSEEPRPPTIFEIKALVAKTYGISTVDLENDSREHKYLLPRSIAMHLAHRLSAQSWAQIALRFGGRHHASALKANRRMSERRAHEPIFDAELCALERQLTGQ
jgi:chromosomal replication initiation ATPase DnaA